jgi:hypothetical protein
MEAVWKRDRTTFRFMAFLAGLSRLIPHGH